jgi:hypothetical protein
VRVTLSHDLGILSRPPKGCEVKHIVFKPKDHTERRIAEREGALKDRVEYGQDVRC